MIDTTKLLVLQGSDAARSAKIGFIQEAPPGDQPPPPPPPVETDVT